MDYSYNSHKDNDYIYHNTLFHLILYKSNILHSISSLILHINHLNLSIISISSYCSSVNFISVTKSYIKYCCDSYSTNYYKYCKSSLKTHYSPPYKTHKDSANDIVVSGISSSSSIHHTLHTSICMYCESLITFYPTIPTLHFFLQLGFCLCHIQFSHLIK